MSGKMLFGDKDEASYQALIYMFLIRESQNQI